MSNDTFLANEIVDVSRELSKEFQAIYLQLSETLLHNLDNETMLTIAEYEDYLQTLQLLELRYTEHSC